MTIELKTSALEFIPGMFVHMTQMCAEQQAAKQKLSELSCSAVKEKQAALALLGKGMWYANTQLTHAEFQRTPVLNSLKDRKVERRMLLDINRPCLDRIKKLAEASLKNVRKVFDQF